MAEVNGYSVLEKFVLKYPTRKAAAKALGVSQAYLTDMLYQRRDLSRQILEKLGLRRAVVPK